MTLAEWWEWIRVGHLKVGGAQEIWTGLTEFSILAKKQSERGHIVTEHNLANMMSRVSLEVWPR